MAKCGECGHEEIIPGPGRTVSRIFGKHPNARNRSRTCLGGTLEIGTKNSQTGGVDWHPEPKWISANSG